MNTLTPVRLVAVHAGLGRPSSTRLLADRLADAAAQRLAEAGRPAEIETVELRDLAVDIANAMVTGLPGSRLRAVLDTVTAADGLIAVTPVFTASYSGLFKSFFDIVDKDSLTGKPVLIAATGGTSRHSLVLDHAVRPLFAYLRAVVLPTGVYAAAEDWGNADGLSGRIDRAGRELAALAAGPAGAITPPAPRRPTSDFEAFDNVVPFEQQMAALRAGIT
jgi:FMN reductase